MHLDSAKFNWFVALVLVLGSAVAGCESRNDLSQPPKASLGKPIDTKVTLLPRYPSQPGSPKPQPVIWFEPTDMTTALGPSPLKVGLDRLGLNVDTKDIGTLAQEVSLATWPELALVASTNALVPFAADPNGGKRAYVQLNPTATLPDRWYVLRVAKLPAGFQTPPFSVHHQLADGSLGARFRPGSDPRVWGISFCEKPGAIYAINVFFSERVIAPAGATASLEVRQGGNKLQLAVGQEPPSFGLEAIHLSTEKLDPAATLEFAVLPGITSVDGGTPLKDQTAKTSFSYQTVVAKLQPWGAGCRKFTP
jgi:hypothetical protein